MSRKSGRGHAASRSSISSFSSGSSVTKDEHAKGLCFECNDGKVVYVPDKAIDHIKSAQIYVFKFTQEGRHGKPKMIVPYSSSIVRKVIQIFRMSDIDIKNPKEAALNTKNTVSKDREIQCADMDNLTALLCVATYLDMDIISDALADFICSKLEGKGPSEFGRQFRILRDFSQKEEDELAEEISYFNLG